MRKACSLCALLLASCTSAPTEQAASASASSAPSGMTGSELCHALLIAPLDRELASCTTSDQGPDLEDKKAKVASAHTQCLEQIAQPLEDGRLALDDERARGCIAAVERAGDAWLGPHAYVLDLAPYADCQAMLTPLQAAGDVCSTALECPGALECSATDGTVGRCAPGTGENTTCSPRTLAFGVTRRAGCAKGVTCRTTPRTFTLSDIAADKGTKPSEPLVVRRGKVTVSGGLPVVLVERIVGQQFGRFRTCYREALREKPDLAGEIRMSFTIKMDGSVANLSSEAPTVPVPSAVRCVTERVSGLSFPVPDQKPARVVYTLGLGSAARMANPSLPDRYEPKAVALATWPVIGSCDPLVPPTQPCSIHIDCAPDAYCSTGLAPEEPNRCVPRKAVGARCTQSSECKGRCLDETCVAWCGSG